MLHPVVCISGFLLHPVSCFASRDVIISHFTTSCAAVKGAQLQRVDVCLLWKFKGGKSYTYMYDNKLCFGASKAPGIFQRITESVTRMMKRMGYDKVFVYLDDFIIVADSYEGCMKAFVCLAQLLFRLGFTINWN